jgi:hypothetical protein
MKRIFIILFLNICYFQISLLSQLPILEFDDYTPRWYYYISDSLYNQGSNPDANQYNTVTIGSTIYSDGYAYPRQLNYSNDAQRYDGFFLHKIRMEDGQKIWSKNINTRHGFEHLAFNDFYLNNLGNIFVTGKRWTNIMPGEYKWSVSGFAQETILEFSGVDGILLSKIYDDQDSIGKFQPLLFGHYYRFNPIDNAFRRYNFSNYRIFMEKFNNETKKYEGTDNKPIRFDMEFNTVKSLNLANFISYKDDRLCSYHYASSKNPNASPDEAKIVYWNTNEDTLSIKKELDIYKYFKKLPPSGFGTEFFFTLTGNNEDLFIAKTWFDVDSLPIIQFWMLWLDKEGNEKVYVEKARVTGTNFIYELVNPFFVDDYGVYMVGSPSITGRKGNDIIRLERDGTLKTIANLTTKDNKRMTGIRPSMDEDGNMVFQCIWDNLYTTVFGLHISDFGINLSSEDMDFTPPKPLLTVSPNPAADHIVLSVKDETYTKGVVSIRDIDGKIVLSQSCQTGEQIDVHHVPSGTYIVLFNPESRPDYFLTTKLVKP